MSPLSMRLETDQRGDFLVVTCGKGREFAIDATDREILGNYEWRSYKNRDTFYVVRNGVHNGARKTFLLHREIMDAATGTTVDHIDWDGLNDRRYNLRLATGQQNSAYVRPGKRSHGSTPISGKRGVYPIGRRWVATISIVGKIRYLGTFATIDEAARAWDVAAIAARGADFTHLNFP